MSAANRDDDLLARGLADVDDLPRPQRPKLALANLWPMLQAAVEQAATTPRERQLDEFHKRVALVVPANGYATSLDGWARLGVYEGALAGWENRPPRPAKDTTSLSEAQTYMVAAMGACSMTLAAIAEVRRG